MFLNNISNTLTEKGRRIQFKDGSFLSTCDHDEASKILGEQVLNEVNMFKTELYPSLKFFKNSYENYLKQRQPVDGFITIKHLKLSPLVPVLVDAGIVTDKAKKRYTPEVLLETFVSNINADEMDIEEVKELFYTSSQPETEISKVILESMTDAEIKEFFNTYCRVFVKSGTELMDRTQKSYRDFGASDAKSLFNSRKASLVWCYAKKRYYDETMSSNLPLEVKNDVLSGVIREIETILGLGATTYREYMEKGVVVIDGYEDNTVYILDENFTVFAEQAKNDVWSAISGSYHKYASIKMEDAPKVKTVEMLLNNEDLFINCYNAVLRSETIKEEESFIIKMRRLIVELSEDVYNTYITNDKSDFTTYASAKSFSNAVADYLRTVSDADLLNNPLKISIDVVGRLLYNNTSFYLFLNSSSDVEEIITNFDVKEDSEMSLWTINFLTHFLVNSLEVV